MAAKKPTLPKPSAPIPPQVLGPEAFILIHFPRIPDKDPKAALIARIEEEKEYRAGNKLPKLDVARTINLTAFHFHKLAESAHPRLGLPPAPPPPPKIPGNTPQARAARKAVAEQIRTAHETQRAQTMAEIGTTFAALQAVEKDKVPAWFKSGLARLFLMEGGALDEGASFYNKQERLIGGVGQTGPTATLDASSEAMRLATAAQPHLPEGHPFKHGPITGPRFWQNARATHMQIMTVYAHMKSDLKTLDSIPENKMSTEQKWAFVPLLNSIPVPARMVMQQLLHGDSRRPGVDLSLSDIKLEQVSDKIKSDMAWNPRIYVSEAYQAKEKARYTDAKGRPLPKPPIVQLLTGRIANLKDNFAEVLASIEKSVQTDYEKITGASYHGEVEAMSSSKGPPAAPPKPAEKTPAAAPAVQEAGTPLRIRVSPKSEPVPLPRARPAAAKTTTISNQESQTLGRMAEVALKNGAKKNPAPKNSPLVR